MAQGAPRFLARMLATGLADAATAGKARRTHQGRSRPRDASAACSELEGATEASPLLWHSVEAANRHGMSTTGVTPSPVQAHRSPLARAAALP